jgi:hypothetical protein
MNTKTPHQAGFLVQGENRLFQFHFLVIHMLASFGIKFLDQQFLGGGLLVFAGGVEVTGTGCGFQLDFFASAFGCHDVLSVGLLSLATSAQICEHSVNTIFVDQTQTGVRDPQTNPAVFRLNPETTILQVRQEPALVFVVGVGNCVPNHRAFARDFTYACH